MKTSKLVFGFLLLALMLPPLVWAQPPSGTPSLAKIDQATVEYHGSWQWLADKFHTYEMKYHENGYYYFADSFDLDLDNDDERWMKISYLGHVYTISAEKSPTATTDFIFTVTKDSKPCGPNPNGRVLKTLPKGFLGVFDPLRTEFVGDYVNACGIAFSAVRYGALTVESNIGIVHVYFSYAEAMKNWKEMQDHITKNNLASLITSVNNSRDKFRVVELKDPNDVIPGTGAYKVYSKPIGLDEEATGKENGVVITNNGEILYVIFLKKTFSNELFVAKPSTNKKLSEYASWKDLKADAFINWQPIREVELSTMEKIENYIQAGAGIVAIPGVVVGGAYAIGAGSVAVYGITTVSALNSIAAATASTAGFAPGVTGGALVGTAGAGAAPITLISLTPLGWILVGTAAVAGTGYTVYHFTDSDTYGYDNGGLLINWDSQLFTLKNEAEVNFMLIKDPDFTLPSATPTIPTITPVPSATPTTAGVFAYIKGEIDTSANADTVAEIKQKIQSFPNALAVPNTGEGLDWQGFKIMQYSGEGAGEISRQVMVEQSNQAAKNIAVSFTAILEFEKDGRELDCDSTVLNSKGKTGAPLTANCSLGGKQVLKATLVGIDDFSFNEDYASPQFQVSGNASVYLLLEEPKQLKFTNLIDSAGRENVIAENKVSFENPREFKLQLENVSTSHSLFLLPEHDCTALKEVLKARSEVQEGSNWRAMASDPEFYKLWGQEFGKELKFLGRAAAAFGYGAYVGATNFVSGAVGGVSGGESSLGFLTVDFSMLPSSTVSGLRVLPDRYSSIEIEGSKVGLAMMQPAFVQKMGEKFLWKISKYNGKEIAQSELNSEAGKDLTLYACQFTNETEIKIKEAKVTISFKKISDCTGMLECFARVGWQFATGLFGATKTGS